MRKTLLGLAVLPLSLLSAMPMSALAASSPSQTEAQRIAALEAKVQALEAELQAMKSAPSAVAAQPPAAPVAQDQNAAAESEVDSLAASPMETEAASTAPASVSAPAGDSGGGSNANAFNPAISIILNGSYTHHSLDPDAYARSGFPLSGEGRPAPNGFSLGESEVSFA